MSVLIQAVNVVTVSKNLQAQLLEWPYMMDEECAVERSEMINKSQSNCPWIGIYRQQQTLEVRTLGFGSGYRRQNIMFALVLQEGSMVSGEDCEERMERLIAETVSAVCSDESIRGSCDSLGPDPFLITYSSYQVEENAFYQEAVLSFTVVTNVNATVTA